MQIQRPVLTIPLLLVVGGAARGQCIGTNVKTDVVLPERWSDQLVLRVVPMQTTYVRFEPITLIIYEINKGPDPLPCYPSLNTHANLLVHRDGEPERPCLFDLTERLALSVRPWPPGERVLARMVMPDPLRPNFKPGAANLVSDRLGALHFRYDVTFDGKKRVSSEVATVQVRDVTPEDRELLEYLRTWDRVPLAYAKDWDRVDMLFGNRVPPRVESPALFFKDIVDRFPSSSFTPYALLQLAYQASRMDIQPRDRDYELAYWAADQIIKKFPDSAAAEEAARYVVVTLRLLGRDGELGRREAELRKLDARSDFMVFESPARGAIADAP